MSRNVLLRRSMLNELDDDKSSKRQKIASIDDLLRDGNRALQEKRFEQAVVQYTNAIEIAANDKDALFMIYSLRATAAINAGKTGLALNDAKMMIKLERSNYNGYLRAATYEGMSGNFNNAIKVIELGLKNVPPTENDGRAKFNTCRSRMERKCRDNAIFQKAADPFDRLPLEIMETILTFVGYNQVVRMTAVCRKWRAQIGSAHLLRHIIDTREARRLITYRQLQVMLARLKDRPQFLALDKLDTNATRLANSELQKKIKWESLQSLICQDVDLRVPFNRWAGMKKLKNVRISVEEEMVFSLRQIITGCPDIQTLHIHRVIAQTPVLAQMRPEPLDHDLRAENLQSLTLSAQGFGGINLKMHHFPALVSLDVSNLTFANGLDLTGVTHLRSLALDNILAQPTQYSGRLEDLSITVPYERDHRLPPNLDLSQFSALHLSSLRLHGSLALALIEQILRPELDEIALRHLCLQDFDDPGKLEELSLNDSCKSKLRKVETLLLESVNIVDRNAPMIFRLFPTVRDLVLEDASVTEAFLVDIPKTGLLQSITFRDCGQISDAAIKWGAARGIEIKVIRGPWCDEGRSAQLVRWG